MYRFLAISLVALLLAGCSPKSEKEGVVLSKETYPSFSAMTKMSTIKHRVTVRFGDEKPVQFDITQEEYDRLTENMTAVFVFQKGVGYTLKK
jgi:uncharacterized lipoprotein NlpE involved in copper resistance